MRVVFEAIGASVEAPGASGTEVKPSAGQSFRIRTSSACQFFALTGHRLSGGSVKITSPLMHDAVLAVQDVYESENQRTRIIDPGQPMRSQDEFKVTIAGSDTAGVFEQNVLHLRYEDVPGLGGEFLDLAALRKQGMEHLTIRVDLDLTAGNDWTGDATLVSFEDQLKANSRYAVTGWSSQGLPRSVIRMESPDWGNLGIATPHNFTSERAVLSTFMLLAQTGVAIVPVFNSSNKSLVTLSGLSAVTGTIQVYVHLVRLK